MASVSVPNPDSAESANMRHKPHTWEFSPSSMEADRGRSALHVLCRDCHSRASCSSTTYRWAPEEVRSQLLEFVASVFPADCNEAFRVNCTDFVLTS